ncbi:MAG: flippase-like domain-containing protein, partial [Synergistaceae bacterium]|nr:flippase-like domain-containing protein [Synergistaceae bacterium]
IIVPMSLVIDPSVINSSRFVKGVAGYVFTVIFMTWAFIAFTVRRPDLVKKVGNGFTIWLKRFKIIKKEKVLPWCRWISRETDNYSLNIKLSFSTGKWNFLLAVICSGLHLLTIFSVLPCLMLSMGLPFNYTQTILTQAIFMFVLYFIPTPGASGVAEVGGAALFTTLMEDYMAGVMAVMWRFFTEYLSIFMGVMIVIRLLGWGVTENIYKTDKAGETEEKVKNA